MVKEKKNFGKWVLCLLLMMLCLLPGGMIRAKAADKTREVNIKAEDINDCQIYYSEGDGLIPIEEGEVIQKNTTGPYGIVFFAAPHEGYALSAMVASNSNGDYYTISDGAPDGSGSEFYTCEGGKNIQKLQKNAGFSEDQIRDMLTEAIDLGCDGVLLFSRGATDSAPIRSNLIFYSEKLPTLEKQVASVIPKDGGASREYSSDMSVGIGDVIEYDLNVTFYELKNKNFSMDYSDVYVTDEKTGNGPENPIIIQHPTADELKNLNEDYVITNKVRYTITQEDVKRGTVVNQAQLAYRYKSLHSAGQLDTISDAQAELSVHASVAYQYVSGTRGMDLPEELSALAPVDYTYYQEGAAVPVLPHPQTIYRDEDQEGYWTLEGGDAWTLNGTSIEPNSQFTMPETPVTLTATWIFTGDPAVSVEKDGSIVDASDAAVGESVDYTASYTLAVENTGGETLTRFAIRDDALRSDTSITAEIGGVSIVLDPVYDAQTQTLTFSLPDGLQPGDTLHLTYSCPKTGILEEKKVLTDDSTVGVTAWGEQTGLEIEDEDDLSIMVALEERIMLTPADIVIYAGGDKEGSNVAPGTNLPEPAFYVTLSLEAEQDLREKTGDTKQVDLSEYLTFTDSVGNIWGLEPFSSEGSKSHGSFLYRLVPKSVIEEQDNIQMQFYDEEQGKNIIQSEFDITNALQQEYAMSIYPGENPAVDPLAILTVGNEIVGKYSLGVTPGKLIIRGTTKNLTTSSILSDEPEQDITSIRACAAQTDTDYYLNDSELMIDKEDVALLVDTVVDSRYDETLKTLAEPVLSTMENQDRLYYQFQYIDLVDISRGNTWVTANAPFEVFWPYPDGTGQQDDFTIIHYKGLDRDYNLSNMSSLQLGKDYMLEVYSTGALGQDSKYVTYHELIAGEYGLSFTVNGFSPFVLVWEGEPHGNSGGATHPESTDKPKDEKEPEQSDQPQQPQEPTALNTTDHYAYLIGRGGKGIQPLAPVTRAEVASILFRLLTDESLETYWSTADCYPDVVSGAWYHNAVATMTRMGVLRGDASGSFRPDEPITRAEFVAAAVRFFGTSSDGQEVAFSDVSPDAWYATAVAQGVALGLIEGRGDGTFGPNEPITRAETAAIINRVLGRCAQGVQWAEDAAQWVDNPPQAWYYADMMEASVSHSYEWYGDGKNRTERWTGLLQERDWIALERYGPLA